MAEQFKRGRGRPPKPVADRKRNNLTMRMRDATKQMLEREAKANRRSLSEEAEARIERSFQNQALLPEVLELSFGKPLAGLLLAIGHAMADGGRQGGFVATHSLEGADEWWGVPHGYANAVLAACHVLEAFQPEGKVDLPPIPSDPNDPNPPDYVGNHIARILLLAVAERLSDDSNERGRAIRELLGPMAERLKTGGEQNG